MLRYDHIAIITVGLQARIDLCAKGTFLKDHVPLAFLLCVCHVVLVVIVAGLDLLVEAVEYWDFVSVRTVYKLLEVGNSAGFL